uniref:ribonuclease III n=1 Tax=Timema genevievae TaxID=629358 RepID=A0A7R9PJP7_TIMGE|nr:unnamed protein product [Timema genevievae]
MTRGLKFESQSGGLLMAYHFTDNVHTKCFTPREYQVELLDAAKERNIIVCLGTSSAKIFIATKLIQELANSVRRPWSEGGKRTLYVVDTAALATQQASYIRHLTDLNVAEYTSMDEDEIWDIEFWDYEISLNQVLVMTSEVCLHVLQCQFLQMSEVNLLVLDECHRALREHPMRQIMKEFVSPCIQSPRILGLTAPLLNSSCDPSRLEGELRRLEMTLHSTAETASDIVSVLRYCSKPIELVVECAPHMPSTLDETLEQVIMGAREFLDDHRYDPSELYEDEFLEELQGIPDPKIDPQSILSDFLDVLHTLGAWCADKAALALLIHLEKLKVKIPYERHFLLLCMVSSVMIRIRFVFLSVISSLVPLSVTAFYKALLSQWTGPQMTGRSSFESRAICDDYFQPFGEKDRIYKFSSPKVLRLLEILRHFKPEKQITSTLTPITEGSSQGNVHLEVEEGSYRDPENVFGNTAIVKNTSENETICKDVAKDSNDASEDKTIINDVDKDSGDISKYKTIVTDVDQCLDSSDPNLSNNNEAILGKEIAEEAKGCVETVVHELDSKYNNCDNSRDDCNCNDSIFNNDHNDDSHNSSNSNIIVTKGAKILENMNSGTSRETTTKPTENKGATNLNQQYPVKSEATKMVVSPAAEGENNNIASSPSRGRPHRWSRFNRRGFTREDGKIGARGEQLNRPPRNYQDDGDTLCCIVFAKHRFTAKILYNMLNDVRHHDDDLSYLCPQFTVDKIADPAVDLREAESEHRKQEEVLKRFRMRECNLLVATSVLEEGMDMPKCNLVVRFDLPTGYRSYAQSKGRARAADSHYVLVTEEGNRETFLRQLAEYREIEEMLVRKCANQEPPEHEEKDADIYTGSVETIQASQQLHLCLCQPRHRRGSCQQVGMTGLGTYCAKLPSDTFTRLTPLWSVRSMVHEDRTLYSCSLQLPINSPVKQDITGGAVPSRVLARRVAALEACRVLHQAKELDDNLLPIGKESFRLQGEEDSTLALEELEEMVPRDSLEPRPGTTKRRQYYYKRIAEALTDCRPTPGRPSYLYHIGMVLTCPLPEEQNTRGRRIYPPEDFPQGFGILTLKPIPPICPFPIFTRSGEVRVGLELSGAYVVLDEEQLEKIMTFLNYTFTSVLRLQKYLMMFDPDSSENCFFIVPTIKRTKESEACVDWEFLDRIYDNRNLTPCPVKEEERAGFVFDSSRYHDAVIMPWYRNQDQPHYFYVAEICAHLTPKSTFPGSEYKTFDEYYFKKYGIQISNSRQPLLDVDHTSARLNFLTPRLVTLAVYYIMTRNELNSLILSNREALPTSSEETKRAKRESLEQKQILVPELCTVHPFPASLWRKAVCLPCILYRVNALLLADQIRRQVARSISLGTQLNFGWSLADVLRKSKETRKAASEAKSEKSADPTEEAQRLDTMSIKPEEVERPEKTANDIVVEEESKISEDWMEIGTWSNDMAADALEVDEFDPESCALPSNVTLLGGKDRVRYGSPTSWLGFEPDVDGFDSGDDSSDCAGGDYDRSDSSDVKGPSGLRIEFKGDVAEAVEDDAKSRDEKNSSDTSGTQDDIPWDWEVEDDLHDGEKITEKYAFQFHKACEKNLLLIKESGMLVRSHEPLMIHRKTKNGGQGSVSPTETLELRDAPPLPLLILPATSDDNSDSGVCIDLEDLEASSDSGNYEDEQEDSVAMFSFDAQPDLDGHPGPSPAIILQALTMSNANDGINLERLETIGDSFLKYAITTYLYCTYDTIHEGKLSHLRSKQVSNLNLYRLGRRKVFGESMIATKFEPHDNWLPPCYYVPKELEQALIEAGVPASHWNQADLPALRQLSREEICRLVKERSEELNPNTAPGGTPLSLESLPCFIPYNLLTQHSIPDKSVADCVEALIGAYLISCGPRGALLFMAWLGICVLPRHDVDGEHRIGYRFRDRSYLLQSLTHASYSPNRLTDCYQRLEFLGDAVLDYLITRHLYEDTRQHSPGALTDLRSSLVNNTIFASLAVRYSFHKYFRHLSPGLSEVVDRFVRIQEENGHTISEEYYLIEEEECEEAEDVEVPKALGDVFESVAGAIFLDSNMSLDAVWRVYFRMMKAEIEQFSTNVPKSPIRELLELEPETAKFGPCFRCIRYYGYEVCSIQHFLVRQGYFVIHPFNFKGNWFMTVYVGDVVVRHVGRKKVGECVPATNHRVKYPPLLPGLVQWEKQGLPIGGIVPITRANRGRVLFGAEYRGELVTDGFENMDCGAVQAVERVGGAACAKPHLSHIDSDCLSPGAVLLSHSKPEKLADGRRVRVTVEVFGKGTFKGIGRNYRIAKCTAAKCALKQLKKKGLLSRKQ